MYIVCTHLHFQHAENNYELLNVYLALVLHKIKVELVINIGMQLNLSHTYTFPLNLNNCFHLGQSLVKVPESILICLAASV